MLLDFLTLEENLHLFSRVTRKVLSNSKHTLLCLCGHNVLERIKPNTIENTAVVRPSGWRRKASKERLVFRYVQRMKQINPEEWGHRIPFLGMNKNVFLHVIRFICHTIKM